VAPGDAVKRRQQPLRAQRPICQKRVLEDALFHRHLGCMVDAAGCTRRTPKYWQRGTTRDALADLIRVTLAWSKEGLRRVTSMSTCCR
jgi:hypothetical protein